MVTRKTMSRQEAGRRGAEARWGRTSESRSEREGRETAGSKSRREDRDSRGSRYGRESLQQGRMAGASTRWDRDYDEDREDFEGGNTYIGDRGGRSHAHQQRAGTDRWSRGRDEKNEDFDENEGYLGERGRSHLQHQRAGRAGAAARWGRDFDEDENEGYSVGQRRNYTGWARGYGSENEEYNQLGRRRGGRQETERQGRETLASQYGPDFYRELGRREGQSRRNRQYE
jgi:hypothetical protein